MTGLLIDTHLLLWAVADSGWLPAAARETFAARETPLTFSVVSILEVAIKASRNRGDVPEPDTLRDRLVEVGLRELPIESAHAAAVRHLPLLHSDPFDRLLLAQAQVEGLTLLTADRTLARYPGPIRLVT